MPLPVVEATLQDWHSGHAVGLAHRAVAQDVVEDVVEVVEELESCLSRSAFGVKLQPRAVTEQPSSKCTVAPRLLRSI